jgi:hypothetical protein
MIAETVLKFKNKLDVLYPNGLNGIEPYQLIVTDELKQTGVTKVQLDSKDPIKLNPAVAGVTMPIKIKEVVETKEHTLIWRGCMGYISVDRCEKNDSYFTFMISSLINHALYEIKKEGADLNMYDIKFDPHNPVRDCQDYAAVEFRITCNRKY